MEYNTQQFTQHVRKYIEGGHTGRALEVLSNCLPKDNLFFTDILTLQSQFNELKRQEHLGLDADKMRMRNIVHATAQFLVLIEKQYSPKIPLVAFPSDYPPQRRSSNPKKRRSSTSKKQPIPIMARNAITQTKSHVKNLFMYLGILLVVGLFVYLNYFREVTSNSNDKVSKFGEVIFLDQFERFEEADAQKRKYVNSKWFRISILKVVGVPMPYKILILQNGNLSETMVEAKKVWPLARYLNYSTKCRGDILYDDSLQCYRCDP